MADPLDFAALDDREQQLDQLGASQKYATEHQPAEAAPVLDYARRAGVDFEAAASAPPPPPPASDWGRLVKDHPVLADELSDRGFASAAQDDVKSLSVVERLFGNWSKAVDVVNWQRIVARDSLHKELAVIGNAEREGRATPDQLKRATEIEATLAAMPEPKYGFVAGVIPAVVGMVPALARASRQAAIGMAAGAAFGAAAGAPVVGVGAVPGAAGGGLTGLGVGFQAGMMLDTAETERGLAYREYVRLGATPQAAAIAADIVGFANGTLMGVPAGRVLNLVPGLKGLLAGSATRDVVRRLIASNTGRAALARFGARVAESGFTMALLNNGMELVKELGAIGAGVDPGDVAQRHLEATRSGLQLGIGFGAIHGALPYVADMREVDAAKSRVEMYKAIGQVATDSKLRERLPDEYKRYVNRMITENGGPVQEAKVPAEKLTALFQREGMSEDEVARVMPEVSRQLGEAARDGEPGREVVVPMADLAARLAPLRTFPELHDDLRVGDELTPREAREVERSVGEQLRAAPAEPAAPDEPARRVYEDVYRQLTENAGRAPENAAREATLWAYFAASRGRRMRVDPWEYYSRRHVEVGADFRTPEGARELHQPTSRAVVATLGGGESRITYPGSPIGLTLSRGESRGEPVIFSDTLSLGAPETPENLTRFGRQGYSTALYLRALQLAQEEGRGFESSAVRSTATERMYDRLRGLGVPVRLDPEAHGGMGARYVTGADLRKVDLGEVERLNEANAEIKSLYQTDEEAPPQSPAFFSMVEAAVQGAKQEKGDAKSWLSVISKTPGVKKEEIDYLGIEEWLRGVANARGDKAKLTALGLPDDFRGTLTREQVAEYARRHQVTVEERVLGATTAEKASEATREEASQILNDLGISTRENHINGRPRYSLFALVSEESKDLGDILQHHLDNVGDLTREQVGEVRDLEARMEAFSDPESEVAIQAREELVRKKRAAVERLGNYLLFEDRGLASAEERYRVYALEREILDIGADPSLASYELMKEAAREIEEITNRDVFATVGDDLSYDFRGFVDVERELTDRDEILAHLNEYDGSRAAQDARDAMAVVEAGAEREEDTSEYRDYTLKRGKVAEPGSYRELLMYAPGYAVGYESPHFGESGGNVKLMMHVRFSEHDIGGRTLFVEEIQSDLHQKAREIVQELKTEIKNTEEMISSLQDDQIRISKDTNDEAELRRLDAQIADDRGKLKVLRARLALGGYDSRAALAARLVLKEKIAHTQKKETYIVATDPVTGRYVEREKNDYPDQRERFSKILWKEVLDSDEAVPDAPFKQTWEEVGAKRLLMWAAEHRYERIAWTTGDVQAKRYEGALLERVQRITYAEGKLQGWRKEYSEAKWERVIDKEVPENQLKLYVGKEMADKLLLSGEVAGEDLKIGGEGMRFAYDVRLPSIVEKLVKKYGGEVRQEPHPALSKVGPETIVPREGLDELGVAREVLSKMEEQAARLREVADAYSLKMDWGEGLPPEKQVELRRAESLARQLGVPFADARQALDRVEKAVPYVREATEGKIRPEELWTLIFDVGPTRDHARMSDVKEWKEDVGLDLAPYFQVKQDRIDVPVWTATLPEKLREQIRTLGMPLFQKGEGAAYRGKISFDEARTWMQVTLTGRADLSTFLHESGHAFLEFLRADAEAGDAASVKEMKIVSEYLGSPDGRLTEAQLETWARSFEAYLREGRAPSPGLAETFRHLSDWLRYVYRSLTGLGVELTDEVRGVMDRLLATDEEVAASREGLGLRPMDTAGMDEAGARAYRALFEEAVGRARERADRETLRNVGAAVRADRDRARAAAEEAAAGDRDLNAREAIRSGRRLDGSAPDEAVAGRKLDREAVAALLPDPAARRRLLPLTEAGGLDPEAAAPYHGYAGGAEMVRALAGKPSRAEFVRGEVDRRMRERYPDYGGGREWARAASLRALHDESVGNLLWAEARATASQGGLQAPRTAARRAARELAARRVSEMTALEMQPGRFARAEGQAAREWADALRRRDFPAATSAKMRQVLAHELWRAADEGRGRVEEIRDYLAKRGEAASARRIGRAGPAYSEAVATILSDIELARQSNRALARRASLESYLREVEDEGAVLSIPQEVRSEAGLKNYRQMTLGDLEAVRDAVRNIEAAARLKNRLFDGRARRNLEQTAARLAEHVRAGLGAKYAERAGEGQNPSWWDSKKEWLRTGRAQLKKIEFVTRELDGGDTAGWAHELIFQPFASAENRKNRMFERVIGDLMDPIRKLSLAERLRYDRTVDFLGTPMKMRDVLSVALNFGSEGNRRKLLDGYAYRGWTEEAVLGRLEDLLTDKDLDLVEHVSRNVNSLWPEIRALSERVTGVAPPKVEALPFTIRGREVKGGYFPIVYDRRRGYKAEQIAQRKTGDLWENNFLLPAVSKGFTESRTKFYAPIELSLTVVPDHLNEVVHYLTHYEPVRAVDRLLNHKLVRQAITEAEGREVYNLFRPWLQSIARDGVVHEGTTVLDGIFRHLRVGATVVALGGKVSTALLQALGLYNTIKEIGPKYTLVGAYQLLREIEFSAEPFRDANERSPQVRDFEKQMSRELLNDFNNQLAVFSGLGRAKDRVAHFSLGLMDLVQKTVNVITWYGAREKAVAEEHPRPDEYANSVVRLSQMGEGIKDKAAIQRGGELTKTFTMMYSYFNVLFNQLSERGPGTAWEKVSRKAATWWWLVTLPVATEMLLGRGAWQTRKGGDEEPWWKKFASQQFQYASRGVPGWSMMVDTLASDGDPRYAPWMTTMLRSLKARARMAEGADLSEKDKRDLVDSIGIAGHLPTTAARNAYRYLEAYSDGNLEEPVADLLFRSPSDWK